ncbi:MAG TPA: hypothetical protein VJJ72_00340 [Candidatus Paceibacterota bacterium]
MFTFIVARDSEGYFAVARPESGDLGGNDVDIIFQVSSESLDEAINQIRQKCRRRGIKKVFGMPDITGSRPEAA